MFYNYFIIQICNFYEKFRRISEESLWMGVRNLTLQYFINTWLMTVQVLLNEYHRVIFLSLIKYQIGLLLGV